MVGMKRKTFGLTLAVGALGLLTSCSNSYDETCGVPGKVLACLCDDGTRGVLMCGANGEAGPCEAQGGTPCRASDVPAAGSGGTAAGDGDGVPGDGDGVPGTGGLPGDGDGTGGTPGNGTGGTPGDGDNTAVVPGAWGACQSGSDCPDGYTCRGANTGPGSYCSARCQGSASDCPPPPSGNAVPMCQFQGPLGFNCILTCGNGETCPDGMNCSGSGLPGGTDACGWP